MLFTQCTFGSNSFTAVFVIATTERCVHSSPTRGWGEARGSGSADALIPPYSLWEGGGESGGLNGGPWSPSGPATTGANARIPPTAILTCSNTDGCHWAARPVASPCPLRNSPALASFRAVPRSVARWWHHRAEVCTLAGMAETILDLS